MSEKGKKQAATRVSYKALGMSIGLVLGGLVGILIDNMIIFAGGGMVVGFALGAYLDSRMQT